jgi:hypothetical protein
MKVTRVVGASDFLIAKYPRLRIVATGMGGVASVALGLTLAFEAFRDFPSWLSNLTATMLGIVLVGGLSLMFWCTAVVIAHRNAIGTVGRFMLVVWGIPYVGVIAALSAAVWRGRRSAVANPPGKQGSK